MTQNNQVRISESAKKKITANIKRMKPRSAGHAISLGESLDDMLERLELYEVKRADKAR